MNICISFIWFYDTVLIRHSFNVGIKRTFDPRTLKPLLETQFCCGSWLGFKICDHVLYSSWPTQTRKYVVWIHY